MVVPPTAARRLRVRTLPYSASDGYVAGTSFSGATWKEQVMSRFSFFEQMKEFAHGVIDTRSVLLLVSLTFFFLFLTLRAVESRRWK